MSWWTQSRCTCGGSKERHHSEKHTFPTRSLVTTHNLSHIPTKTTSEPCSSHNRRYGNQLKWIQLMAQFQTLIIRVPFWEGESHQNMHYLNGSPGVSVPRFHSLQWSGVWQATTQTFIVDCCTVLTYTVAHVHCSCHNHIHTTTHTHTHTHTHIHTHMHKHTCTVYVPLKTYTKSRTLTCTGYALMIIHSHIQCTVYKPHTIHIPQCHESVPMQLQNSAHSPFLLHRVIAGNDIISGFHCLRLTQFG